MAQISYGTITITDTTDKKVYIGYANDAQGTNLSNLPSPERIFVGININNNDYSQSSPPLPPVSDSNWTWSEYIGGDGVSVVQTKNIYFLKRTTDDAPVAPIDTINITSKSTEAGIWTTAVPTYILNAVYYTSIQTDLDNGKYPHSTAVIDQALTNMNYNAAMANSIAQNANENANGALSIATGVEQHFFWIGEDYSTSVPAGAYMAERGKDEFKANPTGGNLITRTDGIYIRNGANLLSSLTGSALNFYQPPTTNGNTVTQGALTIELSNGELNFYNTNGVVTSSFGDSISLASNGAAITIGSTSSYNTYINTQGLSLRNGITENAKLDSNGLVLSKGGIKAGSGNNFIYLSTEGYPLRGEVIDGDTSNGFTINNHTPSVNSSGNNDPAWKQIIGTKFGVDSEGNLYASDVKITGHIEATSGYLSTGVRIGNANGPHISIEDSMIVFWKGEEKDSQEQIIETNKSAYITGEYMYIPYTVVLNEMVVGEREPAVETDKPIRLWSWRKMSNENLRLVWMGGED